MTVSTRYTSSKSYINSPAFFQFCYDLHWVHVKAQFFTLVLFLYFCVCSKAVGVGDVSASASLHLSCCVLLETCSFESVGHVALMCSSQRKWCSVYFTDIPWFASEVFLNGIRKFFFFRLFVAAVHHRILVLASCKRLPMGCIPKALWDRKTGFMFIFYYIHFMYKQPFQTEVFNKTRKDHKHIVRHLWWPKIM